MYTISGKVVLKETGVGIPDLLVVTNDVDPATSPGAALPSAPSPTGAASATATPVIGLGSQLTEERGAFKITFEDNDFRISNPGKRPNLRVSILAPEEPGSTEQSRVLFTSTEARQNAGRTEQYLIRIPAAALTNAGIPLPLDPSVAKEQPQAVVRKMKQAVDYRLTLEQETRNIATQQVDIARKKAQQTDAVVEIRLLESLTGVTAAQAERFNIVLPGAKPEATVWKTVNKGIDNVVNTRPLAGYLVLSSSEAQRFRDANGHFRDHIPAEEIEPFLYDAAAAAKRPISILRADPTAALCREHDAPDPLVTGSSGTGTVPSTGSAGGTQPTSDQPLTAQDLPKFIGRLVNPIVPPEQNGVFDNQARPTLADVQNGVRALQIGTGPADVTAFYDFHQLQIAFDYVWQHAIDDGILATGKALCRQLIDEGSDPLPSLQNGSDPVEVLRNEVRHVASAQKSLQAAGIAYRLAANANGASDGGAVARAIAPHPGGSPGVPPPTPPPTPPIKIRPPFFGDVVVMNPDPNDLLAVLNDMLSERYKFEVFAPGSTNFGLLVTYRQKWDPITYQVGNLVKTLTLAPKETRKVTSRRTIKRERSVKELEANQRIRKDETTETMRDEAEVVRRAQDKTNFSLSAKGSYNILISDGDSTTTFTKDAEAASQETKKAFHEAVLKAAQEFKDERKLEVETKETIDEETTDSTELTNPNDELTVTYLFYELQRRYRVSEHIHRLTPVVFVAMEVPNPNRSAIDRVLLAHSWIINRVLLDDRYRAPLDYLCTRIVGDELRLQELAKNVEAVRLALDDLKKMHKDIEAALAAEKAALQAAIEARARTVAKKDTEGLLQSAEDWLFGSGSGDDLEAARIREDAAKEAYERAVREEKDLRMRLDAETAALNAATEAYAKARAEHANHLLEIAGLRVHFKENVLYYMQAIWSFTFRDQIFFSLSSVKVPKLTAAQKTYSVMEPAQMPLSITPKPGQVVLEVHADVKLASNLDPSQDFVTLAEAADLDHPLGYKGNYMIFPLKQSNPLTDFMMVPYLDSELGIHDPDDSGSWTPEDFAKYARCLQEKLKDDLSPSDFAALQSHLKEQYKRIVSNPRVTSDEVIVPTTSLYIEALPGAHPLLEDFKLEHRAIDVRRAKEEVRKLQMETLRYAARILGDKLEDPDIDKKVIIEGAANPTVET